MFDLVFFLWRKELSHTLGSLLLMGVNSSGDKVNEGYDVS